MSLRQIAKELGISPAYLSYMLNGKRPWRKDLYQRYMGVVNTFVNSDVVGEETQLEVGEGISPSQEEKSLERAMGFEPTTSCLGSKHSTPELRPLALGTQAGAPAGQVYQNVSAESGDTKVMGRCLSRGPESVGIRRELR